MKWLSGHWDKRILKARKRKWFILYPDTYTASFWMFVNILLFLYSSIFLPYKIAFLDQDNPNEDMIILEWSVNFVFIIDIVVSSISAYYSNGEMVDDFKIIFKDYLSTWLLFDILSVFPFEIFFLIQESYKDLAKLPRVLKILKIFKVISISDNLSKNSSFAKFVSRMKLNKQFNEFFIFLITIILFTHITGCFWYFLTKFNEENNWI